MLFAGNITQKHLTLPGDVLVTIKPNIQSAGATTFSLPNLHGDIFATINADGSLTSTFMTGPFGEHLPNQITQPPNTLAPTQAPLNTTTGTTYHYVGQHQKMTDLESSAIMGGITQMGARVYLPILGRFLQVDPVEGGGDNAYVYVNDPVNHNDLDGMVPPIVVGVAWHLGRVAVQHAIRHAVKHSAKHAVKHVTKRVATNAAKKRVQWSAGKFHNAGRNAAYHYNKHARKIGARSQKAYNLSARNTVRRHIYYHRYKNGHRAYMDRRGRLTVVNRRGNYVTHFKPKSKNYWRNNVIGR